MQLQVFIKEFLLSNTQSKTYLLPATRLRHNKKSSIEVTLTKQVYDSDTGKIMVILADFPGANALERDRITDEDENGMANTFPEVVAVYDSASRFIFLSFLPRISNYVESDINTYRLLKKPIKISVDGLVYRFCTDRLFMKMAFGRITNLIFDMFQSGIRQPESYVLSAQESATMKEFAVYLYTRNQSEHFMGEAFFDSAANQRDEFNSAFFCTGNPYVLEDCSVNLYKYVAAYNLHQRGWEKKLIEELFDSLEFRKRIYRYYALYQQVCRNLKWLQTPLKDDDSTDYMRHVIHKALKWYKIASTEIPNESCIEYRMTGKRPRRLKPTVCENVYYFSANRCADNLIYFEDQQGNQTAVNQDLLVFRLYEDLFPSLKQYYSFVENMDVKVIGPNGYDCSLILCGYPGKEAAFKIDMASLINPDTSMSDDHKTKYSNAVYKSAEAEVDYIVPQLKSILFSELLKATEYIINLPPYVLNENEKLYAKDLAATARIYNLSADEYAYEDFAMQIVGEDLEYENGQIKINRTADNCYLLRDHFNLYDDIVDEFDFNECAIDCFLGNEGAIKIAVDKLAKMQKVREQLRKYSALFKETKRSFAELAHPRKSSAFDCNIVDYINHFNSLRGMNEIRGSEPLTLQYYASTTKKKFQCKLNDIGQRICHISAGRFSENTCFLRDCFGKQGPLTTDVLALKLDKEIFCKESTYSNLLQAMQCTLYVEGNPWLIISDEKVIIELL